jgi:hypothetical protein
MIVDSRSLPFGRSRRVPEDDAMQDDSRKSGVRQAEVLGPDTIEARMRTRIRETIEAIVEEELEAALGRALGARGRVAAGLSGS